MPEARVGIDVGGTFTDVVIVRDGTLSVTKVPSTPTAPADGVLDGFDESTNSVGVPPAEIEFLAHGTTVATNAVLEGEWAETALVTTEGFRDVLEIGRQDRPSLYDLTARKPQPVVPRDRRYEVPGRLDERGNELEPIDGDAVERVAETIAAAEATSVAVCLLFAFEDDRHERSVAETIARETDLPVTRSAAVLPAVREYERTLVTALNAALLPVMGTYLSGLERRLSERSVGASLAVMQSNGGTIAADRAAAEPVRTLLSGPAAGVRGAAFVAETAGEPDVLTLDMGGTSCDVSLVRDGVPAVSREVTVGDYPVGLPMVDVHTIGAGGGSIAWVDDGGALRVGPRSAGANPGPICYGRGGTRPTVTDAQYLLGRLDPGRFAAGALSVDRSAVEDELTEQVAGPLDRSVRDAARGIVDVANASMERALRVVSVERGIDPRDLAIVAFGGAGALHAADLAAGLGIPQVLVPRAAGVLSALGLLVGDVIEDVHTSRIRPWDEVDPGTLEERFAEFRSTGVDRLEAEGIPPADRRFERSVDVRYAGQAYELTVPIDTPVDAAALAAAADRFHSAHRERYGHANPGEPLELVGLKLRARGVVEPPTLPAPSGGSLTAALREHRSVVFDESVAETPVYDRDALPIDDAIRGPAVVAGAATTVLVRPADTARLDDAGTLHLEVG